MLNKSQFYTDFMGLIYGIILFRLCKMPRSGSTSRSNSTSRNSSSGSSSSKSSIPYSSPPVPHSSPPSYTPSIRVEQPTMFQSAIQGFGLGMGSSIARNMFESKQPIVQYHAPVPASVSSSPASESTLKTYEVKKFEFKKCMENTNDYDTCVHHLE